MTQGIGILQVLVPNHSLPLLLLLPYARLGFCRAFCQSLPSMKIPHTTVACPLWPWRLAFACFANMLCRLLPRLDCSVLS